MASAQGVRVLINCLPKIIILFARSHTKICYWSFISCKYKVITIITIGQTKPEQPERWALSLNFSLAHDFGRPKAARPPSPDHLFGCANSPALLATSKSGENHGFQAKPGQHITNCAARCLRVYGLLALLPALKEKPEIEEGDEKATCSRLRSPILLPFCLMGFFLTGVLKFTGLPIGMSVLFSSTSSVWIGFKLYIVLLFSTLSVVGIDKRGVHPFFPLLSLSRASSTSPRRLWWAWIFP